MDRVLADRSARDGHDHELPPGAVDHVALDVPAQLPAGLSGAEVAERVAAGAVNDVREPASRSMSSIVRANVFTRFNALLGGMWVVVLVLGSYQDALFGLWWSTP